MIFVCIITIVTGVASQQQQQQSHHHQPSPSFGSVMENVTVIKGRDASFTCVVLNIGPHRVSTKDICETCVKLLRVL